MIFTHLGAVPDGHKLVGPVCVTCLQNVLKVQKDDTLWAVMAACTTERREAMCELDRRAGRPARAPR